MNRWAVFDVDGTLLPGTSMEKMFMLHLIKQRALPLQGFVFYFLRLVLKLLYENSTEAFKNNKYYLKNLSISNLKTTAEQFVNRQILPRISQTGVDKINQLHEEGYRVLLMSGSPDFLVDPLAEHLKPDYTIANVLETKDDFFTGRVVGLHPYGERKKQLLEGLTAKLQIDFSRSVVFANHHADADHMQLFAKAVAVNPTRKLRKLALVNNWEIEIWR